MAEAHKKLNPGWWEKMTSGGVRYDEAGELFMKAGNMYKKDKQLDEAMNAFVQAAKTFSLGKDAHDAANAYVQAGNCAKQASNVSVAVDYLQKAVDIYSDDGKYVVFVVFLRFGFDFWFYFQKIYLNIKP